MITKLTFCLALLISCTSINAANPSYSNFPTSQFNQVGNSLYIKGSGLTNLNGTNISYSDLTSNYVVVYIGGKLTNSIIYQPITLPGDSILGIGNTNVFIFTDHGGLVAVGDSALRGNLGGTSFHDTAFGFEAMLFQTNGDHNVAIGGKSLRASYNSFENTAVGFDALDGLTTQNDNTAVGAYAGTGSSSQGDKNTYLGANVFATGAYTNSTAIGYNSRINGDNQFRLGNGSTAAVSTAGVYQGTNGLASFSTTAGVSIAATGWTNTFSGNATVYVTATAVAWVIKNRANATIYTSPTLTATVSVNLQPGWAVTAASGLAGTALPF